MKKMLVILVALFVVMLGIYFTGAYTYFQGKEVSEALPEEMMGSQSTGQGESARPMTVKEGEFVDADFFHTGSGKAKIIRSGEGNLLLRFEEFSVVNGPDVHVYLSKSSIPGNTLKSLGDYLDLGLLKGNKGDQNYELPADAEGYTSVVLWCEKFGVLFPYAVLE